MADFATVDEADLETAPQPSEGLTGNGAGALTKGTYEPVNDNDLVPAGGPAGPTGEFAYKGIPAAAAARFKASNAVTNIFGAGVSGWANGYANDFNALADKDKQTLVEGGYGDYRAGFPGSLLQHAADMFNSGLALTVDGFMALGGGISGATGAIEGQIARETGAPEDVAKSAEREGGFVGMAAQSDIGAFHAASLLDAAKANAAVPGVYGHAYRFDVTPEGTAKATPLGRLPAEGPESLAQAATTADALHLPPSAADVIHRTYVETGRPPAEVLMDAKTNHGGVLSDLVAGIIPQAYLPTHPVLDIGEIGRLGREASLNELDASLASQLEKLPAGDVSAQDRLNRLQTVEDQLANPDITAADRKSLQTRRDQILVDTNPEALKAATQPLIDRRNLEAQRARISEQLADIQAERDKAQTRVALGRQPNLQGGPSSSVDSMGPLIGGNEPVAPPPELGHTATTAAAEPPSVAARPASTPVGVASETAAAPTKSSALEKTALREGRGISKIGKSIEAKAVEDGLTEGFGNTAGYDKITIADQSARTADLINTDLDKARAVIRGEEPLPSGMKGTALITAMEDYIKKNPNADLAYELANSPLVTGTSEAAQEMRLAAERTPDSAAAKLAEIKAAQAKIVTPKIAAARRAAIKEALPEAGKVLLPKEELSWDRFLEAIAC